MIHNIYQEFFYQVVVIIGLKNGSKPITSCSIISLSNLFVKNYTNVVNILNSANEIVSHSDPYHTHEKVSMISFNGIQMEEYRINHMYVSYLLKFMHLVLTYRIFFNLTLLQFMVDVFADCLQLYDA